jgi:hypothetical protein
MHREGPSVSRTTLANGSASAYGEEFDRALME